MNKTVIYKSTFALSEPSHFLTFLTISKLNQTAYHQSANITDITYSYRKSRLQYLFYHQRVL